jgi:hypothetical protein
MDPPVEVSPEKKYDTVVTSGQAALRALFTMTGGATIAFLTFIGHLLDSKALSHGSVPAFVDALKLFMSGTAYAVFAYGMIFLTNCMSYVEWKRTTNVLFILAVVCGYVSFAYFIAASSRAVVAFQSVPH